jgi:hypothetical protein
VFDQSASTAPASNSSPRAAAFFNASASACSRAMVAHCLQRSFPAPLRRRAADVLAIAADAFLQLVEPAPGAHDDGGLRQLMHSFFSHAEPTCQYRAGDERTTLRLRPHRELASNIPPARTNWQRMPLHWHPLLMRLAQGSASVA